MVMPLRVVALYAICIGMGSCGGSYFVGFVSNPVGSTSITGTIVSVNIGFASAPSGMTTVTVVTFANGGTATTLYFCGEQQTLFPLNQTVRADYTSGVLCSLVVKVAVVT